MRGVQEEMFCQESPRCVRRGRVGCRLCRRLASGSAFLEEAELGSKGVRQLSW